MRRGVDDLNLLTTWADKTHLRNVLAHETYRDAGAPTAISPSRSASSRTARSSASPTWSRTATTTSSNAWGSIREGALYKMYNSAESVAGSEKKTRKNEGTPTWPGPHRRACRRPTRPRARLSCSTTSTCREMVNFLAAKIITADTDCCHKNYYLYRDSRRHAANGSAMPWDVDLSFGRVWTCGDPCSLLR